MTVPVADLRYYRLIRHVVVRALANQYFALEAIKRVAEGQSPADVCREMRVGKNVLRGWIQRVQEAYGTFGWEPAFLAAYELVRHRVEPIIVLSGDGLRCSLCGARVTFQTAAPHVASRHDSLVCRFSRELL